MRSISSGRFAGSTRVALFAGAASIALALPSAAFAQDAGDGVDESEDDFSNVIVVTATKREQTLQETPISVSVTSGETLEQAQIRDVLDLQTVTPSLRVSQLQNSSSTTFIIRGFGNGDNNFGIEPSVGVFIDGVFRSRSAASLNDLPNVQRIEVLNGPQSTLFGKNASAGVISVVTRPPQFTFGGSAEVSYGNFNALVFKGDVTGPISDNIAFSIDGSYNSRDGYGTIVNLDEEVSERNRWSARGQLLIEPTPDLSVRLIGDYSRFDEACCVVSTLVAGPTAGALPAVGGQLSTDFFSYDIFLNQVPVNETDNYGVSGQIDWATGPISVTSITAYRKLENFVDQDVDFTSADIVSELRDQRVKTFTQELRVSSDFDGPLNFLLGGYYFNEKIKQDSALTTGTAARDFFEILGQFATGDPTFSFSDLEFQGPTSPGLGIAPGGIFAAGPLTAEAYSMDNESYSIFGTVDFEPVEGLVFTAGFNYTDDQKDFALSGQAFDPLANINLADAFIIGALAGAGVDGTDPAQVAAFASNPMTAPIFQGILAGAVDPTVNPLIGLAGFQFQPPFLDTPNAVENGKTSDDKFTYLLRAAYEVSPEINIYGSYATGFKASSVNLSRDSRPVFGDFIPAALPAGVPSIIGGSNFLAPSSPIRDAGLPITNLTTGSRFAGPEKAEVYEIGIKGQWDGVGFNLALFDQTIKGFQSFLFTGTGFQLNNAGQQSVKGFEFDTTINPADGLVLTFAVTHLDPVYDSFVSSPVGDLSGERPGGIPAWNLATSATYTHEWDSGTRLISRLDYSHESNTDINNGLPTFGDDPIFRREVNLVNGSMTLSLNNGFEIGIWGRNLLDDEYIITVFDGVAQAGTVSGYPSAPRTYGGVVRYKF
jgi:outer membrane receptor protein involved in Fe transport